MMMTKAVFLDRDGTINKEVPYLHRIKDLRLLQAAATAIKKFNQLGFLVVIVTNQSGIARGLLNEDKVDEIHAVLIKRLAKKGAKIDAIYYCPHHPSEAKIKKYRIFCRCRKPNVGLIKKAAKEFKIDLRKSFMVGDMTSDILMGKRAGLKTILVKTGFAGKDGKYNIKPDFLANNLSEAVRIIKKS